MISSLPLFNLLTKIKKFEHIILWGRFVEQSGTSKYKHGPVEIKTHFTSVGILERKGVNWDYV